MDEGLDRSLNTANLTNRRMAENVSMIFQGREAGVDRGSNVSESTERANVEDNKTRSARLAPIVFVSVAWGPRAHSQSNFGWGCFF